MVLQGNFDLKTALFLNAAGLVISSYIILAPNAPVISRHKRFDERKDNSEQRNSSNGKNLLIQIA